MKVIGSLSTSRIDDASLHSNFPVVGPVNAGQHLDQRRLAGPILAEKRMHFAGTHLEVDFVECNVPAEALRQPLYFKQYPGFAFTVHGGLTRAIGKSRHPPRTSSNPRRQLRRAGDFGSNQCRRVQPFTPHRAR